MQLCPVYPPGLAFEALQLAFRETFSCDCKQASVKFLSAEKNRKSEHHYLRMEELVEKLKTGGDGGLQCCHHKSTCAIPREQLDALIVGFPCAPYSAARSERWKLGWTSAVGANNNLLILCCLGLKGTPSTVKRQPPNYHEVLCREVLRSFVNGFSSLKSVARNSCPTQSARTEVAKTQTKGYDRYVAETSNWGKQIVCVALGLLG